MIFRCPYLILKDETIVLIIGFLRRSRVKKRLFVSISTGLLVLGVIISCMQEKSAADGKPSVTMKTDSTACFKVIYDARGISGQVVSYDDMFLCGGGIQGKKGMKYLYERGVRKIVSINPSEREKMLCKKFGMHLVELPFATDHIPTATVDSFLVTIQNMNAPLYVHGNDNDVRAGILGAIYRIYMYKWPFVRAMEEFVALGGSTENDSLIIASLRTYDRRKEQNNR